MSKPSMIIVLLEDDHQQRVVYRYLKLRGLARESVFKSSPSGEGSGEQWVRQRFVKEVTAYRGRRAKAETALIVVIDADRRSVQQRLNQLQQTLRDAGLPVVGDSERVA